MSVMTEGNGRDFYTHNVANANLLKNTCALPFGSRPLVNEKSRVTGTSIKDDAKLSNKTKIAITFITHD